MTEIQSRSAPLPMERASIQADSSALNLQTAQDLARQKARAINPDAMLLAWFDARTGRGYPDIQCGRTDKPPWEVFAESRGGNLTIDVNDGTYTFIYLML